MNFDFHCETETLWHPPLTEIKKWLTVWDQLPAIIKHKKTNYIHNPLYLSLSCVSKETSQKLNRDYRGNDRPTNVLSFAAPPQPDMVVMDDNFIGDIIITSDVIVEEAKQQHKPEVLHFAHMLCHGILHCIGYDHQTDEQADLMEMQEIEWLYKVGFPNPYAQN